MIAYCIIGYESLYKLIASTDEKFSYRVEELTLVHMEME